MENEKYLNDISEIKNLMNQSSRFISLSGLSGILAGFYCLIGAYFAYRTIYFDATGMEGYRTLVISPNAVIKLLMIAIIVILFSIVTGVLLSIKKAKKKQENVWNIASKRLILNFMIPLVTGGLFILVLISKEIYGLIAPLTLIFYGLACVNASKYTLGDIRYLGITLIIFGLINSLFIGYGLLFWALGFGVCHIVYGSMLYIQHDRE